MIDEKKLIEKITTFGERMTKNGMQGDFHSKIIKAITRIIEEQPKVGEWIPVSERLPERQDSKNTFLRMYLVCSERGVVHMGFRDEEGIWRTIHGNRIYNEVAWMPLPEPYKGGE